MPYEVAVCTQEGGKMNRLIIGLAVLVVLVGGKNAWSSVQYTVTDLGELAGSNANGVNDIGQVVGSKSFGGGPTHAFLYSNGVMTDLGVLESSHHYSSATDINDAGLVVGSSMIAENTSSQRPVLFSGGTVTNLGSLGGGYGFAGGINSAGQVVGLSSDANGVTHAFLWSNGTMIDLGSLEGSGGYSCAYGINDNTQVVGVSVFSGANRGFLWEGGVMTDLGDLAEGTGNTRAYAINNLGQVVGESWQDSSASHAFVWQNGAMSDLGVLPGANGSLAEGINDSGVVVGTSYTADGSLHHRLFVWDSTNGMQDANNLLDSSSAGWTLYGCRDINNLGQIVGWGTNPSGQIHGVLLTPIPEPTTIIIWSLLGILGITIGWWRRKRAA